MNIKFNFPPRQESIPAITISFFFICLTAIYVGLRPEHILLTAFFYICFFAHKESRKLIVGLLPFFAFGISYDWMRILPNYKVNPIDVESLYNLEKSLFGIMDQGVKLIPSEYFALHSKPVLDFFAGIFYLGWIPVPVLFGVYLYLTNKKELFLRFALVFLIVNIIGFIGYYIHPAAPPWYAINYGFEPILNTPGNMAGLSRFDDLLGIGVFDSIYGRNANVFASVPSLHSAYLVIVLYYAIKNKSNIFILSVVTLFMCGIWGTAVYTAHHYVIDVILGTLCAGLGIFLFENVLMKLPFFQRYLYRYATYIS
jgi:hypothetical protein